MKQLGFDTSGCATLSAALETSYQMTRRVGGENDEQNNKVWAKSFLIYSKNLSPTGLYSTKDKDTPIKRPTQQHVIVQKNEVVPQSNWCPAKNEKASINTHVPPLFKKTDQATTPKLYDEWT